MISTMTVVIIPKDFDGGAVVVSEVNLCSSLVVEGGGGEGVMNAIHKFILIERL